ncbi:predicted protein [Postia placenta Mad-698-R]|uniref:Uncharacterized protein n=1 Tax=Postia placenta MAD-698-R-SB12 TaxID=670580 RepID=A0A1X6MWF0_9APHY|nr:hypothetical protein POSPLADRAFT_1147755 [Postia placenta MAD-698-R-SB12]EED81125.1 predicted protein [Postia placenta Mad-698-R]OSX60533.1 hypothetical protein POSPLADRAFT_1147755 [Postia placenta MAD-698-R-SB12]
MCKQDLMQVSNSVGIPSKEKKDRPQGSCANIPVPPPQLSIEEAHQSGSESEPALMHAADSHHHASWPLVMYEAWVIMAIRTGRDSRLDGVYKQLLQVENELDVVRREYQTLEGWCDTLVATLIQHNITVPEYPPSQAQTGSAWTQKRGAGGKWLLEGVECSMSGLDDSLYCPRMEDACYHMRDDEHGSGMFKTTPHQMFRHHGVIKGLLMSQVCHSGCQEHIVHAEALRHVCDPLAALVLTHLGFTAYLIV